MLDLFFKKTTNIIHKCFRWTIQWNINVRIEIMRDKPRKEYARIHISEAIDVNKTNASKECNICHYWYFKDIGFKHEPHVS